MTLRNLSCLALLLTAACAQGVGDVDRTQPNRIRKTVFEGEWYLQKTTFDVPYTAGFTFTGETSELERVRWEVQERHLIAYRTYDIVENTQGANTLPDGTFRGAPVAAYEIESHFDVVRDYHPLTGEETNLIIENTVDRPWYEREYVRVNWSKNQVASFAFLDDQVAQSPMDYYVQDRADADRLLLAEKTEAGWVEHQDWEEIARLERADYIDLVDTLFAEPEQVEFYDEYGDLVSYPACWFYGATDCQPARIKVRSSFLKVDATPYEALAYPDNAVARDQSGNAYRDELGDPIRVPYFDKFGFFRVERDYYDRNRERTETARTFLINRWDIWKDAPACKDAAGSYAACEVQPIVYYLSPGFPEAQVAAGQAVVGQWNDALKAVVNQLKYGGQRSLDQVEDVFILKPNDYAPGVSRGQRIGDLRYSYLYWVPEPQAVGPLGYGPSAADPLTGRILSASAYIYGAGLESWSAWAADVVQAINGTLDLDDLIEGEDIRSYVTRVRGDYARTATEVAAAGRARKAQGRAFVKSDAVQAGRAKQRRLGKRGMRLENAKVRAKLNAIRDTPFEDALLSDELVRALVPSARGAPQGVAATLSPDQKARISPAGWGTRGAMRARAQARKLKIQKANLYLAAFADDAMMGLAESLQGKTWEEVKAEVVDAVFASTAAHEIGHTLGLRHNFAASYDALNYFPEYWRLRGADPQPFEDMSEAQARGRMREYQYSSIMDYGARFSSDIHGIGAYDRAAILFGYGQLVEVFEAPPEEPLAEVVGLPYALQELRHYTSLPGLFGGDPDAMYRRRLVPYQQVVDETTGAVRKTVDEVPYRFCSDEYDGAVPSCNTWDEGADAWEVVNNAADRYERYYIFNAFGRDQREVEPWDHLDRVYYRYFLYGQLHYQQWVFQAFDLEGFWDELRADADYYGIEDVPYDEAVDGGLSGALASQRGLQMLADVIQAPEPGAYYEDPDEHVFYNYSYDQDIELCPPGTTEDPYCSELNVPLGPGKYAFSIYQADSGYYFYERVRVIGSFYDKLAALQTLTSPETNFLGVDADANFTAFAISMYLMFPDQVTRLVGGSAVETYEAFAGVMRDQLYEPRDVFADPAMYASLKPVDPATSFTVELYAAWLGMAFLNANFDNSFNDSMRVFEEGSGEAPSLAVTDPERIARFTHPRTGRTFVAVRHEDPARFSPAFELLKKVQRLADTADPAYRDYYIETSVALVDNLRGLYEIYGKLAF
jgi:hypothetical protein